MRITPCENAHKRIAALLGLCALLLSAGCSDVERRVQTENSLPISDVVEHDSLSQDARFAPEWVNAKGIGIGFVWPKDRNLPPNERPQTEEIHLADGEDFNPLLILNSDQPRTALVSVLLDYKQIEFELDGQEGLLHEVAVEPGIDLELPIEVKVEGEGAHDLIVLAFYDPYNLSLDPDYRISMNPRMVGRRAVVVVGDKNDPFMDLGKPTPGVPVPADITLNLRVAFATAPGEAKTHPSQRQLFIATAQSGQSFDFQVWVSNREGDLASDYLLLPFLDFHQIRLNELNFILIRLEPDEELYFDTSLQIPEESGIKQLQIVYVFDPYRSVLREEVRAPFVFASPRIAIEVNR